MSNVIHIGPWVGEFGHMLMHVAPFMRQYKIDHPDTKIVFSSFEEDKFFVEDCVDEYIPFKFWYVMRGNADIHGPLPDYVQKIYNEFAQKENHYDICNIPLPKYTQMIKNQRKLYKRLDAGLPPNIGKTIVAMPRTKPGDRTWPMYLWIELIEHLAATYDTVFIGGIYDPAYDKIQHPNVVDFTRVDDRSRKMVRILNGAVACAADCSGGSQISVMCGCPTIVHGPDVFSNIYDLSNPNHKNFFGARCTYHSWGENMFSLSVEERLRDIIHFAGKDGKRYLHDEVSVL